MSSDNNEEIVPESGTQQAAKAAPDFGTQLTEIMADAPPEYLAVLAPTFKELLGLVQLATLGNAESVADLLSKPGSFMKNLCSYNKGALMGYLQAKALHQVMTTESKKDPLDWAKLAADINKEQAKNAGKADAGPASNEVKTAKYELLQDLDAERKEVQKAKSGGSGS